MNELTSQEIRYLLKVLEQNRGWKTRDVSIETAKLDDTDIYFLQQKLEKQLNLVQ